jgi:predicted nucleic acid-binding protein
MFLTLSEYRVFPITKSLMTSASRLYQSRPDKEWGLTDCVSFALMQRERIKGALTADPHFRQAGFVPLLLEPEISA